MKYIKTFESNKYSFNDLVTALNNKNKVLIKEIVDSGVDLNKPDKDGYYIDAYIKHDKEGKNIDILEFLVNLGMKPDNISKNNTLSFIFCADKDIINWLHKYIELGADISLKDKNDEDIFDKLDKKEIDIIINKYPKQYKNYLIKKSAEKYNI